MKVFYLDYSFDVLISQIGNVGLYNSFCCSYLTYCLISCSYMLIFTKHLLYTRVTTWACQLALSYVLAGLILDNPRSSCLDPKCLNHGGLTVTDQSEQQILPWRSERSWSLDIIVALPPSSSPDWLSRPLLLLVSTSQLLLCISLHIMYFYIFLVM